MLKKIQKSGLVILLALISFSASFLANAGEPPALAKLSGAEKARVAKLIEGAKKEGTLVGYSSSFRPDIQEIMFPKFREWYGLSASELQIKMVSLRSDAIVTKVTEELRAKVYKLDIVHSSAIDWFNDLVVRGALMSYDSPEYKQYCPISVNPEMGPANPPYFIASSFSVSGIVYNPKHVKGDILHWKDLLRPEYKGKISIPDASNSTSHTETYVGIRKVLDANFFRELARQGLFVLVSSQDLINKAISGEYPIVAMGPTSTAFNANLEGAGLKLAFPPAGSAVVGRQMAILARAPHPNAAKLFIDFFHSEVAQKTLLEEAGMSPGRLAMKSKYLEFPVPIYDMKGVIAMDWRKITAKDRENAREEFRRIVIERK